MSLALQGLLLLAVLIIAGVGLFLTLMEIRQVRVTRERHISLVGVAGGAVPAKGAALLGGRLDAGWVADVGRRLRGIFAVGLPRSWGMHMGGPVLLAAAVIGAASGWLAAHSGLHFSNLVSVPVGVALGFLAPRALLKRQQNGADAQFMEAFPETIEMVVRMLRAGLPITAAVRSVGNEAPPPVNAVFTKLADEMAIGITFEDALSAAGARIGLTDFQFFAVAVALQRATGGNLTATLQILSDIMRKRRAMRLKARATTGEVRMSAYVLGAIPFLVLGGLLAMTPDYLQPLIDDRRGNVIIAVAIGSLLVGFGMIRQMMRSVTHAT